MKFKLLKLQNSIEKSYKRITKMYNHILRQIDYKLAEEFFDYAFKYRVYETTKEKLKQELFNADETQIETLKLIDRHAEKAYTFNLSGENFTNHFKSLNVGDENTKNFLRYCETHKMLALENKLYIKRAINDSQFHLTGSFLRKQDQAMNEEIVNHNTLVEEYNKTLEYGRKSGKDLKSFLKKDELKPNAFSDSRYIALLKYINAKQDAKYLAQHSMAINAQDFLTK